MRSVAMLALERHGRLIPLCRAHSPRAVKAVAGAALAEVRAAARAQEEGGDEMLGALLRQEAERLKKGFRLLGLEPACKDGVK